MLVLRPQRIYEILRNGFSVRSSKPELGKKPHSDKTSCALAHHQGRKSLPLCRAGLRIWRFDPIAEAAELPDHSRRALLLRLFGDGWAPFFVTNSLVQDQPDQSAVSMGDGPDGLIVPRRGTERRYTISKMLPFVLAAALAAWLSKRRMWRLPLGERWL